MSWADSFLIVLTLLSGINVWALIGVRRRVSRAEAQLAIQAQRLRGLRRDVDTVTFWISPNHQLPPHIKRLDVKP